MLIGSAYAKERAAHSAALVAHTFGGEMLRLSGSEIAFHQAAIFDHHHAGRVKSVMDAAGENPNLTAADVSSLAACWLANALRLVPHEERSATMAGILCIASSMIVEADGTANPN